MTEATITHEAKIQWMAMWAARNSLTLQLDGSCGFGRDCVGVSDGDQYVDYHWYDRKTYKELDQNGNVWCPPDAYHKHECVAVLGHGEAAEAQLYDWLQWFDANGFAVERGIQEVDPELGPIAYMLGQHKFCRMVRKAPKEAA